MAYSYDCNSCGKENYVIVDDIRNQGMGFGDAMATEIGWHGTMSGSPFIGGPGPMSGRRAPREFVHYCKYCKAKNILETD